MNLKNVFLVLFTAGLFTIAGCSKDSPLDAANAWRDAVISGDMEAADSYTQEDLRPFNKMMYYLVQNEPDNPNVRYFRSYNYDKEEIKGNTAKVYYSGAPAEKILLEKKEEKWIISIEKQ